MKVTFPHMGNAYVTIKALLDDLEVPYVIPPKNSKEALVIGTKYAPEFACLPLKINIGNYIESYKLGADTVLLTGGCGPCRYGYYGELEREILKDLGMNMDIVVLEAPDNNLLELYKRIKKVCGKINIYKFVKALKNAIYISRYVDELESLSFKIRARETRKGSTNKIFDRFLQKAYTTEGSQAMIELIKSIKSEFLRLDIDITVKPLKVGVVGEIYTTIDNYANFNMARCLGEMGIEVDRKNSLSVWIIDHMLKPSIGLKGDLKFVDESKPYLGTMIGGHAQETIGNSIIYAKDEYDGIIQIYPLGCMPEIVAESILPKIEENFGIPILTLIVDELTGEAGIQTRIEAFVDLLEKRRERGNYDEECLLFGN